MHLRIAYIYNAPISIKNMQIKNMQIKDNVYKLKITFTVTTTLKVLEYTQILGKHMNMLFLFFMMEMELLCVIIFVNQM